MVASRFCLLAIALLVGTHAEVYTRFVHDADPLDAITPKDVEAPNDENAVDNAVQKQIDEDAAKNDRSDEQTSEDAEPASMVTEDNAEEQSLPEDDQEEPEDASLLESAQDMDKSDNERFAQTDALNEVIEDVDDDSEGDAGAETEQSDNQLATQVDGEDEGQEGVNDDSDDDEEKKSSCGEDDENRNDLDSDEIAAGSDKPDDGISLADMYDSDTDGADDDADDNTEEALLQTGEEIDGFEQFADDEATGEDKDEQQDEHIEARANHLQEAEDDDDEGDEDDEEERDETGIHDPDGAIGEVVSDKVEEEEDDSPDSEPDATAHA